MVSGVMLLVGIAGVVTAIRSANGLAEHQRHVSHAIHIAEGTIEELMLRYNDHADLAAGSHTGPDYSVDGQRLGSGATGWFSTEGRIQAGTPVAATRRVTVTVSWQERDAPRTLTLVTHRR